MPWNAWIGNGVWSALLHRGISSAYAARFHFDAHLTLARLRKRPLHHLKRSARMRDLHGFHRGHLCTSFAASPLRGAGR